MLTLEIPYEPGQATWRLDGLAEGSRDFDSRVSALTFAMAAAQRHAHDHGAARICIQGTDGMWRTFNETMTPIPA